MNWVSAKERLPEVYEYVILTVEGDDGERKLIDFARYDPRLGWMELDGDDWNEVKESVTHWMTWPEPCMD